MTSLCRQLSAQEIVNWVTTADGCVHTADATRLDSFVSSASAVCIGFHTVAESCLCGLEIELVYPAGRPQTVINLPSMRCSVFPVCSGILRDVNPSNVGLSSPLAEPPSPGRPRNTGVRCCGGCTWSLYNALMVFVDADVLFLMLNCRPALQLYCSQY